MARHHSLWEKCGKTRFEIWLYLPVDRVLLLDEQNAGKHLDMSLDLNQTAPSKLKIGASLPDVYRPSFKNTEADEIEFFLQGNGDSFARYFPARPALGIVDQPYSYAYWRINNHYLNQIREATEYDWHPVLTARWMEPQINSYTG